jgi:hypothetical protein
MKLLSTPLTAGFRWKEHLLFGLWSWITWQIVSAENLGHGFTEASKANTLKSTRKGPVTAGELAIALAMFASDVKETTDENFRKSPRRRRGWECTNPNLYQ